MTQWTAAGPEDGDDVEDGSGVWNSLLGARWFEVRDSLLGTRAGKELGCRYENFMFLG
jgi:hypothetical protein